ncbi:hypothetical protein [Jiella sp. M17.18]|uniref:hypothetical protein n=1 Tax=Jiella sp. M17.18 TaxID=3234247 RepID=UPI0034DFE90B
MIRPTLLACLAACVLMPAAAAAQDDSPLPAWRSGPASDATMDVGQRFDCVGPGCPNGLSCLYAMGPYRPPGSWPITAEFIMDPAKMPWSDYEFWLTEKAKALRPVLAEDPLVRSDRFAERSEPQKLSLADQTLVKRDYVLASKLRAFAIPAFLWAARGRLTTMFCIVPRQEEQAAQVPERDLLAWLLPRSLKDAK